jgi:glutamate N-acetyltransferase/amino-acid N-acetyltransferase
MSTQGGHASTDGGDRSTNDPPVAAPGEHVSGPPQPFFRSRWVPRPSHVRDLGPHVPLPGGFRAAGVACGIKPSGRTDLGLLVCDTPAPVSAARFTASALPAAPVEVTRARCRLDGLRAVLANSGSANAATGERGRQDAAATQDATAAVLGCQASEVALASTGAISHELPVDAILRGLPEAAGRLHPEGSGDFQRAILTTDASEKRARLEVNLPSGAVVGLSAQCKGAGMISPRFATMLCFVQTDAALTPETAELLLGVCLKRSFERVSVDGQLSTNDTVILMCSGASGVHIEPESRDELRFGEALDALLRQLAIMLVADGEGAGRIARVLVQGGDPGTAQAVARAIGNSPLVKTALHGGDPNWGRILQALGAVLDLGDDLASAPPPAVDLSIEGIQVCAAGSAVDYDEPGLRAAVQRAEVEYAVQLPGQDAEAELFFSDLSHEYVTINAEYTT